MIEPIPKPGKRKKNQGTTSWLAFRSVFLEGKKNFEEYYVCEWCGAWTKEPEVHHLQERSIRAHLIYEPTNLVVICNDCHTTHHTKRKAQKA